MIVHTFLKQKIYYFIYFSLLEITLRQQAKALIFINLIIWKRNQTFKLQQKTWFSYFSVSTLLHQRLLTLIVFFFLIYCFSRLQFSCSYTASEFDSFLWKSQDNKQEAVNFTAFLVLFKLKVIDLLKGTERALT